MVDRRDRRFRGHRHRQDDLRRSGQEPVQPRAGRACLPADRLSRPDDVVPAAGRCRGRCLFGCYAAGGGQVRGGVGLGDRLSGHALRIDSRLAGRGGCAGAAGGFRLSAVASGHHMACSGDDSGHHGPVRLFRGSRPRLDGQPALRVPRFPRAGGRRHSGCGLHGHRLLHLADDRARRCDLRRGDRRHHDVHPPVGRLSRGHVVCDSGDERHRAPYQSICQTQAFRRQKV